MSRLKRLVRWWLLRRHPVRMVGPVCDPWIPALSPGVSIRVYGGHPLGLRDRLHVRRVRLERRLWWWSGAGAERFRAFAAAGTRGGVSSLAS